MSKAEAKSAASKTSETAKRALLLELEYVVVNGRQIMYDVLKSVLADKGAALTPVLFSKYCLHDTPNVFMGKLLAKLDKGRVAADKLIADTTDGINMSLLDSNVSVGKGVKSVLASARKMGVSVGFLSALEKDTATQLAGNLGLLDDDIVLLSHTPNYGDKNGSNAWQKLARRIGVPYVKCVAVTTSQESCGSAVAAGMRCVVACDKMTAFQDFGGADLVTEDMDGDSVKSIIAMLESF